MKVKDEIAALAALGASLPPETATAGYVGAVLLHPGGGEIIGQAMRNNEGLCGWCGDPMTEAEPPTVMVLVGRVAILFCSRCVDGVEEDALAGQAWTLATPQSS